MQCVGNVGGCRKHDGDMLQKQAAKHAHMVKTVPSRLLIINKLKVYSTQALITVEISGNPTGMSINVNFSWKMGKLISKSPNSEITGQSTISASEM